ncbi:MAG: oxidoreductase, partial [Betaproteobacteria bacterium]
DHPRLIDGCMALLSPGGELIFSNNRRQFELDPGVQQRFHCDPIDGWTIPEDFRNRSIHHCWRIMSSR